MRNAPDLSFPRADLSRIPYGVYHDQETYEREQELIFRGPTWSYLGHEAELPNPGDFLTTYVGETPVILNRAQDGALHAFVNRCAHRGSVVRREVRGNARTHTCIYHQWSYNQAGDLTGIPFRNGVKGKGGLATDFDTACHGLRKLKVQSLKGVVFGSFAETPEPLLDYLDAPVVAHLERLMHSPIRVLGYQRQFIRGNWKLYTDNLRDPYHGGLLHMFQIAFGIARLSNRGGAMMDRRHRHNISYTAEGTDSPDGAKAYEQTARGQAKHQLADHSLLDMRHEWKDGLTLTIMSIFPNVVFQQIRNSLAIRQIRPKGLDAFELHWTYYGYQNDDDEMTKLRLRQANFAGPAGLISMEDGEAIELVHRATARDREAHSIVEMGGRGPIHDQDHLVTDVPMRGFWTYYCELMGFTPGSNM